MAEYHVGSADELSEGERLVVEIEGIPIGIFHLDGDYYAYADWCVHQGGPVCRGNVTGKTKATFDLATLKLETEWTKEGEVLICPWHGWEYDIRTGECYSSGNEAELPSYPVRVEEGEIIITL